MTRSDAKMCGRCSALVVVLIILWVYPPSNYECNLWTCWRKTVVVVPAPPAQAPCPKPPATANLSGVAIGILTSLATRQRIGMQLSSWAAPSDGVEAIWYADFESPSPPVVRCACPPEMRGLPCRTEHLFSDLYRRFPDAKWFFRACDDACVDPVALARQLASMDPEEPLCYADSFFADPTRYDEQAGAQHRFPSGSRPMPYPGGGVGWILSRAAMRRVSENWPLWRSIQARAPHSYADDLMFGYFLRELDISMPRKSCLVQRPEVSWVALERPLPICPPSVRADVPPSAEDPYPPLRACAFHMEAGATSLMCASLSHVRGRIDLAYSLVANQWTPCVLTDGDRRSN